ncbi:MAG: kelch repeat-containing protein [Planctomycetota bacterium]
MLPRLLSVLFLAGFLALRVRAEDAWLDDPPLNFEGEDGKRPSPMPAPEPWPDEKAFKSGEAAVLPHLRIEGYAYRKQQCLWLDVFEKPDGTLEARRLIYYRVGKFDDDCAAFEADLGNGIFLALKVDEKVEPLWRQEGADKNRPNTWKPNVKAAWFGKKGKKPATAKVAAPGDQATSPKDSHVIYHRATNAVVTGPDATVREPNLDWSDLIESLDPYSKDPLKPKELSGEMTIPRRGSQGVMLQDGRVLFVGGWVDKVAVDSAEIFDASTGKFTKTGSCHNAQGWCTLSVCGDGRVLLVPGYGGPDKSAPELYDPKKGMWELAPVLDRTWYTPVSESLADGRVLVYFRNYNEQDTPADIFDPKTMSWSQTPKVVVLHPTATLTRLPCGRILLVGRGGSLGGNIGESIARLYDPGKNSWKDAGAPADVRCMGATILLQDGRVLVAGGAHFKPSAEIYDPGTDKWTYTGDMATDRSSQAMTVLQDGPVLAIGGSFPMPSPPDLPVGEILNLKTLQWTAAARDADIGSDPLAFTLADGSVLVVSGNGEAAWFTVGK